MPINCHYTNEVIILTIWCTMGSQTMLLLSAFFAASCKLIVITQMKLSFSPYGVQWEVKQCCYYLLFCCIMPINCHYTKELNFHHMVYNGRSNNVAIICFFCFIMPIKCHYTKELNFHHRVYNGRAPMLLLSAFCFIRPIRGAPHSTS